MPRPQSQPVLRKAPRKEHPYAPAAANPAVDGSTSGLTAAPEPAAGATTGSEKKEKVFSTRLDPTLIRQVKARALEDDVSVQVLVATALTEYLDRTDG